MDRQPPPRLPQQPMSSQSQHLTLQQVLVANPYMTSMSPRHTPPSPQLLAHLTSPQTIRSPTALSFHINPLAVAAPAAGNQPASFGRLVFSQSIPLGGGSTGFTVVSPTSNISALQVLGGGAFAGAGMMMMQTGQVKSPGTSTPASMINISMVSSANSIGQPMSPTVNRPGLVQKLGSSPAMSRQPAFVASHPAGGTIHHMGQNSSRLPVQQIKTEPSVGKVPGLTLDSRKQRLSSSGEAGGISKSDFSRSYSMPADIASEVASPPIKKIKLEDGVESESEDSVYKRMYIADREHALAESQKTYLGYVSELYFLENNENLLDFHNWIKHPNPHLTAYIQTRKMEDLMLDNEVKFAMTSGGTAIACSKVLPPAAISALQQQQEQKKEQEGQMNARRTGGRHGMVYGYVCPKSIQQRPLVPEIFVNKVKKLLRRREQSLYNNGGIPLSTTAATTTIGSPPPYAASCSSVPSTTVATMVGMTTVAMSSTPQDGILRPIPVVATGLNGIMSSEPGHQSFYSSSGFGSAEVAVDGLSSLEFNSTLSSQEAIVELAKQEAQVVQRIAELRKQGLWSNRRLPKVCEPSRIKSHWDYLLEEMQWMAVDFAQERKWKMGAAGMLANSVKDHHAHLQEIQEMKHQKERGRRQALARSVARMVEHFWSDMAEISLYQRHKKKEKLSNNLLKFIDYAQDIIGMESERIEECNLRDLSKICRDVDLEKEISNLIKEGEMPLETLLEKYGGFDEANASILSPLSTSSSSSSSDDELAEMDDFKMTKIDVDDVTIDSDIDLFHQSIEEAINAGMTLQKTAIALSTSLMRVEKTSLVSSPMRHYQLAGMSWMSKMYMQQLSCILLDEAGLGKKIQAIYFLAYLASDKRNWGPHLIIAPTGSLFVWQTEIARWCPALKCKIYFDKKTDRRKQILDLNDCRPTNICITSYETLNVEWNFFKTKNWRCLILDQVDTLNSVEKFELVLKIQKEKSLALSNKLPTSFSALQLFGLAHLSLPDHLKLQLDQRMPRGKSFKDLSTTGQTDDDITKLSSRVVNSLCLRRNRVDVEAELPRLLQSTVMCPLSHQQQRLYEQYTPEESLQSTFSTRRSLEVLTKLVAVCNHPNLVQPRSVTSPFHSMESIVFELCPTFHSLMDQDLAATCTATDLLSKLINLELCPSEMVAELSAGRKPSPSRRPLVTELTSFSEPKYSSMSTSMSSGDGLMTFPTGENSLFSLPVSEEGDAPLDAASSTSSTSRKDMNEVLARLWHCIQPLYGLKLRSMLLKLTSGAVRFNRGVDLIPSHSKGIKYAIGELYPDWNERTEGFTECLLDLFRIQFNLDVLRLLSTRFSVCGVRATAPELQLVATRRFKSHIWKCEEVLKPVLSKSLTMESHLHLPDPNLLKTLSGKLLALDALLKERLLHNGSRVVIVARVGRLLNILESFLCNRQLRFLRIDGHAKLEDKRKLMQRFNSNRKIPCLLMSASVPGVTRVLGRDGRPDAGSVVVFDVGFGGAEDEFVDELTATMSLTHDLHVYRLVCRSTIEEDMMTRKSNAATSETGPKSCQVLNFSQELNRTLVDESVIGARSRCDSSQSDHFMQALDSHESSDDPRILSEACNVSKRYSGDSGLETSQEPEERLPTESIERRKRKLSVFLSDVREDDDEDDDLYTYIIDRENSQVFVSDLTGEKMSMWTPPTPPQDDTDVYIDNSLMFLYDPCVMSESQLPPVFVGKGRKRVKVEHGSSHKIKIHKEGRFSNPSMPPRSLFDRIQSLPGTHYDRDGRPIKQGIVPSKSFNKSPPLPAMARPLQEPQTDQPEWLIHEDWALLQAYQMHQEESSMGSHIGAAQQTQSSAHQPNWELIADVVNACSRMYRSAKQCKIRYENVIMPREEGKFFYEVNPRNKIKKTTNKVYKTKNNRAMKTQQLYIQDNNRALMTYFNVHFDSVRCLAGKRTTTARSTLVSPLAKSTKHAMLMSEYGIQYDQPLSPVNIATLRADRIAKDNRDKKLNEGKLQNSTSDPQTPSAAAAPTTPSAQPLSQLMLTRMTTQSAVMSAAGSQMVLHPAAGSQVVLQPAGQQLVAAAGQHLLSSSGGLAVANTSIAGLDIRQAMAPGTILTSVTSHLQQQQKVVPGGNVMTPIVAGRSLPMVGIVNQSSGQTYSNLNKPQNVVSTSVGFVTGTNLPQAAAIRAIRNIGPHVQGGTSININVGADAVRGMSTPTQLVVTQHKTGVGVSQLGPGTVLQSRLPVKGMPVQLQMKTQRAGPALQQVRSVGALQQVTVGGANVQKAGMVSATLSSSLAQATTQTIQLKNATQMHALLKQRQMQQQQQQQQQQQFVSQGNRIVSAAGTIAGQGSLSLQQIQMHGKAPQMESIQLQASGNNAATSQTVATLIKTVSAAGSVSNMTIPLTGVSLASIGVGLAQQKLLAGKGLPQGTPQQIRQLQVQKRPSTTTILQPQSKIVGVQPMASKVSLAAVAAGQPLIFQQTQKLIVQPCQKPLQTQIQHLQTSLAQPSSSGTVIATSMIQNQVMTGQVGVSKAVVSAVAIAMTTASAGGATVKLMPTNILTKQIISPPKGPQITVRPPQSLQIPIGQSVVGQSVVGQSIIGQSVIGQSGTVAPAVHPTASMSVTNRPAQQQVPVSLAVQQAVQEVLAQAQVRQPAPSTLTTANVAAVSQATIVQSASSPSLATSASAASQNMSMDASQQGKSSSPYVMRLRNQRS